jgi:hypothetical protein
MMIAAIFSLLVQLFLQAQHFPLQFNHFLLHNCNLSPLPTRNKKE